MAWYLLHQTLAPLCLAGRGLTAHTWHRVYRVDRRLAREMFGARAAAAVPESGLVDVHTYLTVTVGVESIRVDLTFALRERWTGDGHMHLRCGEGFDVRGGRFPNRRKRELVSLHCDPAVREPFIAALSEPLDPSTVADV